MFPNNIRPIRFYVKFSFEDRENILSSTKPSLFIPLMKYVTCKIVELSRVSKELYLIP